MTNGILVAGIGNVFASDDGFGVEVAQRLAGWKPPEGVRVAEYGIRGIHLAYELLEGYDALVLVDAVPMDDAPGTLALIDASEAVRNPSDPFDPEGEPAPAMDAHTMSPEVVLGALAHLGGKIDRVLVVGCRPGSLEPGIGLSPEVAAAAEAAADMCRNVVAELVQPAGKE